jgi:transposase
MVRILRIVCPAAAHSTALTPTARRGQRLLVTLYPSQLQPLREGDSVGTSFVFKNRRGDRLKILAWQGDGFALYLRRLERGSFAFPQADTAEISVTATELAMILGGIEFSGAQRRTRYQRPEATLT